MAQTSSKTLAWLWSVLQNGYHDPPSTYHAIAHTLTTNPTLSPRTEVHTSPTGASSLLLTLSGTLPVTFRGTTYRFPLKVWIPSAFPLEAPMVYITPGSEMVIRPGQHVGVDGRVYHPYLRDWGMMQGRAGLGELLGLLGGVFEREPPVVSRAVQMGFQRPIGQVPQQQQQQQPGAPLPPPKQRSGGVGVGGDAPPPRPPKPGEEGRAPQRDVGRDGPPLPPLPHERPSSGHYGSPRPQQNGYAVPPRPPSQAMPPQGYQNGRPPGPPMPPTPGQQRNYQQRHSQYEQSPVSPVSPVSGYSELPETRYTRPAPLPPHMQPHYQQQPQPFPQGPQYPPQQSQQPQYERQAPQYPPQAILPNKSQHYQLSHPQQQPPQPQKPPPPPDLLTDPFDIALPNQQQQQHPAPAPPIPPNPEKEHLLRALSETLSTQAQQKVSQTLSFLAPLQAQQTALQQATHRLQNELAQLHQLNAQISSNESILHHSLRSCDAVISSAKSKPEPNVDEVLIAPTVVGNQLWAACADEAGLRGAMDVLQKGFDRGRVGSGEFVRLMRGLGRERFWKVLVARRCGRGLGLEGKGI